MTVRVDAAKNPQHYHFLAAYFSVFSKSAGIASQLVPAFFAICVVASTSSAQTSAQTSAPIGISMPTESRVKSTGWWPTKGDASRDSYVGTAVCGRCHASKAATQQTNAMAHAAVRAADAEILRQHDHLSFRLGPYHEEIVTKGEKSVLAVTTSDNATSLSADLFWAFGIGHMGQTYVYEKNGSFYESHLSFFASSQDLNITPGQSLAMPGSLEDAAGRRMPAAESRRCFSCHTTASVTKDQFDVNNAMLGVTCEACHGPGAIHAAAMKSDLPQQGSQTIMNPGRLDPVESVDFCGACHRTWEDVVTNGFIGVGVLNARFAPYRLENSKCWRNPDARLTCVACHDPHLPLEHDAAAYDSRCLQCHVNQPGAKPSADYPGAACPVSAKNCVTCHMPKVESPIQHSSFTDHWIRIVRPGQPYPN
jgi:cytochrome c554/c'-like protein